MVPAEAARATPVCLTKQNARHSAPTSLIARSAVFRRVLRVSVLVEMFAAGFRHVPDAVCAVRPLPRLGPGDVDDRHLIAIAMLVGLGGFVLRRKGRLTRCVLSSLKSSSAAVALVVHAPARFQCAASACRSPHARGLR